MGNKVENEGMPVVRLDRQLKYEGNILKIYEDTVLANGHEAKWDFIHHDGAAAVLPVAADGKILMVRQYRNALERYTLEIPAGGLNGADEPTAVAAARELEEETGYRCEELELLISVRTTVAFCNEKIDVYAARNLVPGIQHLDDDEYLGVEEHTMEELEQMIFRQEIQDAKTIAALMAYKVKYGI